MLDLLTIIAAAAAAATDVATQGYAAAADATASSPLARVLSPLNLLHLCFICRVGTDAEIPHIWLKMCWAPTKADALAVLSEYLWAGRKVFWRDSFVSADMLHICGALFRFVHRDRFVNPWHDPACPAGSVYLWTTRQDGSNMGGNTVSTEGVITALDSANVRHEEVTYATRTKLAVVIVPLIMTTEMRTHTYVLHFLLGGASPVVEALSPLVIWINRNWTEWVCLMAEQDTTTRFAYNNLWIVSVYLNACILALTAAVEGYLGARANFLFKYLINTLDHSRYTGRELLRSLQDILTIRAGRRVPLASASAMPSPAARNIVGTAKPDPEAAAEATGKEG